MTLLDINSEAENVYVWNIIRDSSFNSDDYWWSSGSNMVDGTLWIWLSNGKAVEYHNWDNGEPNNKNEKCISLKKDNRGKLFWNDDYCTTAHPFICQSDLQNGDASESEVGSRVFTHKNRVADDVEVNGKTFYIARHFQGTFWQSLQFCETLGLRAASVLSKEENTALHTYLRNTNGVQKWWTSGTRTTDKYNWYWLSNGLPVSYTNWAAGEPNDRTGETCLNLVFDKDQGLFFNDVGCDAVFPVICEKPQQLRRSKRENEDVDWLVKAQKVLDNIGMLYTYEKKYYIEGDFEADLDDATLYCNFLNMELADIKSEQDTLEIISELKNITGKGPFWIDARKIRTTWKWADENKEVKYTNWKEAYPEENSSKLCVQVDRDGKWINEACGLEAAFICKKRAAPPSPADECEQPVINIYINNNVPAQDDQKFLPIQVEDKSSGSQQSILVNNKWDKKCGN